MSAQSFFAWLDGVRDGRKGLEGPAAAYARAAAEFAAEQNRLHLSGGRPAQGRALAAMADLLFTLPEARRARDEAERRLAEELQDTLDDILAGHRARDVRIIRSGGSGVV